MWLYCVAVLLLSTGSLAQSAAQPPERSGAVGGSPGIVVEAVAKGSAAEKSGLRAGDVLLSWKRDNVQGTFESPFDLTFVETEQLYRGAMTFAGLRGTEHLEWVLIPGRLGIAARPDFPGALLSLYQQGQTAQAAEQWSAAAAQAQKSGSALLRAWFLYLAADSFANSGQWKAADDAYQDVEPVASCWMIFPVLDFEIRGFGSLNFIYTVSHFWGSVHPPPLRWLT